MNENTIMPDVISAFALHLSQDERSRATIEKYVKEARAFTCFLSGSPLDKPAAARWKALLIERGFSPETVNCKLSALNSFLSFLGRSELRLRLLKLQRRLFREERRELTKQEYDRLVSAARSTGRRRLELLLETICSTGIRVSEVQYVTVEAARLGRAQVSMKGKIRLILLPKKLCKKLLSYAREKKIASGEIFLTRGGASMSRKLIWAQMKSLCAAAGVEPSKVFPHNLRHLFARCFYTACRDVAKLADLLGHSSINTTRIYLISTGAEHSRALESLRLVS